MEVGVFIPIGNNGWLISSTSPQYKPSFDLNKTVTQSAERHGLDFVLSMIKLRGFGGPTEFWDHNLDSLTLMAGVGGRDVPYPPVRHGADAGGAARDRRADGRDDRQHLPRAVRSQCHHRVQPGDTSCAADVPAVRLVPRFAREAAQVAAAVALPGNQADDARLRIAAATVLTVGDLVARIPANASGRGVGLRGGTFELSRGTSQVTLTLDGVKWVEDVAVSGSVICGNPTRGVTANLQITQPDGTSGRLSLRWREDVPEPQARIAGTIAGRRVTARVAAP